jgi:hypothetical protein
MSTKILSFFRKIFNPFSPLKKKISGSYIRQLSTDTIMKKFRLPSDFQDHEILWIFIMAVRFHNSTKKE